MLGNVRWYRDMSELQRLTRHRRELNQKDNRVRGKLYKGCSIQRLTLYKVRPILDIEPQRTNESFTKFCHSVVCQSSVAQVDEQTS
jgi:hypothetical protein